MTDLTPVQKSRLEEYRTRFTRPTFLLQIALIVVLAVIPVTFSSFRVIDVVAKIMIFTIAVASFDLILGYTGLLSLGHAMFFGIGAYSMALVVYHSDGPQYYQFILAPLVALGLSIVVASVIAFLSLRVKAIFFAMMTLALADFADILAMQWYDLTRAEDGVSFKLPGIFDVKWVGGTFLGAEVNGRMMTYYLILIVSVLLFIGLLRFVRSPVGRVLKSIRENEPRSTALGYKTFQYQAFSIVFGSSMAALSGILFAMWLRYVNPESSLSTPIMLNILLMVIIGGLGTLYGSIIGTAFIMITQTWLPEMEQLAAEIFPKAEIIQRLAERWVLYFGILFILVVFFFPKGIVGTARDYMAMRKNK